MKITRKRKNTKRARYWRDELDKRVNKSKTKDACKKKKLDTIIKQDCAKNSKKEKSDVRLYFKTLSEMMHKHMYQKIIITQMQANDVLRKLKIIKKKCQSSPQNFQVWEKLICQFEYILEGDDSSTESDISVADYTQKTSCKVATPSVQVFTMPSQTVEDSNIINLTSEDERNFSDGSENDETNQRSVAILSQQSTNNQGRVDKFGNAGFVAKNVDVPNTFISQPQNMSEQMYSQSILTDYIPTDTQPLQDSQTILSAHNQSLNNKSAGRYDKFGNAGFVTKNVDVPSTFMPQSQNMSEQMYSQSILTDYIPTDTQPFSDSQSIQSAHNQNSNNRNAGRDNKFGNTGFVTKNVNVPSTFISQSQNMSEQMYSQSILTNFIPADTQPFQHSQTILSAHNQNLNNKYAGRDGKFGNSTKNDDIPSTLTPQSQNMSQQMYSQSILTDYIPTDTQPLQDTQTYEGSYLNFITSTRNEQNDSIPPIGCTQQTLLQPLNTSFDERNKKVFSNNEMVRSNECSEIIEDSQPSNFVPKVSRVIKTTKRTNFAVKENSTSLNIMKKPRGRAPRKQASQCVTFDLDKNTNEKTLTQVAVFETENYTEEFSRLNITKNVPKIVELDKAQTKARVSQVELHKAQIQTRVSQMELDKVQTQTRASQVELDNVQTQTRASQVDLDKAQTKVRVSQVELNKVQTQTRVSQVELDKAQTQTRVSQVELNKAQTQTRLDYTELGKTQNHVLNQTRPENNGNQIHYEQETDIFQLSPFDARAYDWLRNIDKVEIRDDSYNLSLSEADKIDWDKDFE